MISKTCPICGKKFKVYPYRKDSAKFCSFRCHGESMKGKSSGMLGKYHSETTKNKLSEIRIKKGLASGSKNPSWKGGKFKSRNRWFIWKPEHPFANVHSYIVRSRLIAERYLNRYLSPEEVVHHIGAKDDDRPEMLYLFPNQSEHLKYHRLKNKPKLKSNLFYNLV